MRLACSGTKDSKPWLVGNSLTFRDFSGQVPLGLDRPPLRPQNLSPIMSTPNHTWSSGPFRTGGYPTHLGKQLRYLTSGLATGGGRLHSTVRRAGAQQREGADRGQGTHFSLFLSFWSFAQEEGQQGAAWEFSQSATVLLSDVGDTPCPEPAIGAGRGSISPTRSKL